jgi:Protein of unknown function (DUF433)
VKLLIFQLRPAASAARDAGLRRAAVGHAEDHRFQIPPGFDRAGKQATRVPFRNLIDYLEGGYSLDEFLDSFPSVSREQAVAALEAAHEVLSTRAHPS